MKTPESLETLVDYGIIQEVIRPLMSGKEAQVYVVIAEGKECVAKVYKEANQRTFKHRVEYTEGRRTRNTRDQRAINKRTRHGRKQDEAAWRNAEVDTLYRVRAGGVRVPEPINFVDGVLVMELVRDADGNAAPRLGDLEFPPAEAYAIYQKLVRETVRMLCAGTIHGDLSEFNVLMGAEGPVVIDFPQSVDPSKNQSARKLLLRDVENLHRFLSRHAPEQKIFPLGEEMWALYEKNRLAPETELLGDYQAPVGETNVDEVLALIDDANQDELLRRDARGDDTPLVAQTPAFRRVVDFTAEAKAKSRPPRKGSQPRVRDARPQEGTRRPPLGPAAAKPANASADGAPAKRRTRRRRPRRSGTDDQPAAKPAGDDRPGSPRASRSNQATDTRPAEANNRNPPRKRQRRRGRPSAATDAKPSSPTTGSKGPPSGPASTRGKSDQTSAKGKDAGQSAEGRKRRRRTPRKKTTL